MKMQAKMIALVILLLLLASLSGFGLRQMRAACITWTSKAGMSSARASAAGAEIDGKLYVVGGDFGFPNFTGLLEVYDPATNTWATKASMPTARRLLGAVAIGGKLYAVGGGRQFGIYFNNLEVYDPATNTWTTKTGMPTARHQVAAAAIGGKLYVVGGNSFDLYNKLEVYDPATDTWTSKADMPTARSGAAAAVIDGKLYVIGGAYVPGTAAVFLNTLEVYDPVTDTWASKKGMPTARANLGAVAINGKLYAVGGVIDPIRSGVTSALEVYDPATDTWTSETGMPTGRRGLATVAINGKLYAAGGEASFGAIFNTLEVYEPPPPNTAPTISAVGVTRTAGSPSANSQIATVSDAEDAKNTLTVTVNGSSSATANGVTVSGLSVSAAGVVTANVVAACNATTASFTLRVTDSGCLFADATLAVTVNPNPAPTLSYNNPPSVVIGGSLTVNPASGPSDNVSLASIAVQSTGGYTGGITVNSAGVVSLTNASPLGSFTITIRATDNCGATTDATFTLNVVCPTITLTPATLPNVSVGEAYPATTFTASGGTPPYSFSLSGALPAGLSLTGDTLSGTPTEGGTFSFAVTATDANGCQGGRAYTLVINRPPVLAPIGNKTIAWGNLLGFTAMATDPDGDTLTFSLVEAPAGARINPATGEFSWRPISAQIGQHTFTVVVTDGGTPPLSASETITVTVTPQLPALSLTLFYQSPETPVIVFKATLLDPATSAPLVLRPITFMVGNQTFSGTTDASGVATGSVRLPVPGPHPLKASFAGDAQYAPATAETSFDFTFDGTACHYAILPASQRVPLAGGEGSVEVVASAGNCAWTAQNNTSWITLNPPPGGAGQGSLSFTAAPNPGGARTGTITVAGLSFTLHQQGAANPETIGIFRPAAAAFFLRNSNTAGLAEIAAVYGLPGDVPLVGDWNGDGVDTIGIHRDAFFLLRNANTGGAPEIVVNYGLAGDLPVVGDWNGDGVDTIGVFRGGIFILRNTNTGGPGEITLAFGTTGDLPVAGDWDGDGRVTVGVYRPSDQLFLLRNSLTSGIAEVVVAAGGPGDQPVVGDWDGDGVRTVGVYSAAGIFSLWNTNGGGAAEMIFGFGAGGDVPLAGDWDGLP